MKKNIYFCKPKQNNRINQLKQFVMLSLELNKNRNSLGWLGSIVDLLKPEEMDPITEARRYVDNAREVLRERGKLDTETKSYKDKKYVRAAGNYLWQGVLIALEGVFHIKHSHKRLDIKDYLQAIAQRDKKLLTIVTNAYEVIHLYMNYDGVLSKNVCDDGFELADAIIDRCVAMTK